MSRWVKSVLTGEPQEPPPPVRPDHLLTDEDAQLALWVCYEMHYRGFTDVDEAAEWNLDLIGFRRDIEAGFERELRTATGDAVAAIPGSDIGQALLEYADAARGSGLAAYLQRHASAGQMRQYLVERSIQQLKESDPHSFVLGRLDGPAKVALAELQYDEYGAGRPERMHAQMYAQALASVGLNAGYGAYIDTVGALSLASANVVSMFAFNRRLLPASMGHLAVFEATSSLPCRKIAAGIHRLGLPAVAADYFEEHVVADAVHEQLAARQICGALVAGEPDCRDDVLFGAATCVYIDDRLGQQLLAEWSVGDRAAS